MITYGYEREEDFFLKASEKFVANISRLTSINEQYLLLSGSKDDGVLLLDTKTGCILQRQSGGAGLTLGTAADLEHDLLFIIHPTIICRYSLEPFIEDGQLISRLFFCDDLKGQRLTYTGTLAIDPQKRRLFVVRRDKHTHLSHILLYSNYKGRDVSMFNMSLYDITSLVFNLMNRTLIAVSKGTDRTPAHSMHRFSILNDQTGSILCHIPSSNMYPFCLTIDYYNQKMVSTCIDDQHFSVWQMKPPMCLSNRTHFTHDISEHTPQTGISVVATDCGHLYTFNPFLKKLSRFTFGRRVQSLQLLCLLKVDKSVPLYSYLSHESIGKLWTVINNQMIFNQYPPQPSIRIPPRVPPTLLKIEHKRRILLPKPGVEYFVQWIIEPNHPPQMKYCKRVRYNNNPSEDDTKKSPISKFSNKEILQHWLESQYGHQISTIF